MPRTRSRRDGFAMAALLVGMAVMAIAMSAALPTWRTMALREREAELVFRGEQYARAIALYQRKYANAYPPNLDILVDQRFLRRKYRDPMATDKDGAFQLLYAGQAQPGGASAPQQGRGGAAGASGALGQNGSAAGQPAAQSGAQPGGLAGSVPVGQGGLLGVVSKSDASSLRLYNGRSKYNEWTFVATQASTRAGAPTGTQNPTGGIPGGAAGARGVGQGRGNVPNGVGGFPGGGPGQGRGGRGPGDGTPPGGRGPAPLGGGFSGAGRF